MLIALGPAAVVRWHREGFHRYWNWKGQRVGRPRIYCELRQLNRGMQSRSVTWSAPRIRGELLKLRYELCEATVSKYIKRMRKPRSQSWKTYLANLHMAIAVVDFFTVPTANFELLCVFILIDHAR